MCVQRPLGRQAGASPRLSRFTARRGRRERSPAISLSAPLRPARRPPGLAHAAVARRLHGRGRRGIDAADGRRGLGLPLITGYILVGGMRAVSDRLLDASDLHALGHIINDDAMGFIGFSAGSKFLLSELRGQLRLVMAVLGLVGVTYALVLGGLMAAARSCRSPRIWSRARASPSRSSSRPRRRALAVVGDRIGFCSARRAASRRRCSR